MSFRHRVDCSDDTRVGKGLSICTSYSRNPSFSVQMTIARSAVRATASNIHCRLPLPCILVLELGQSGPPRHQSRHNPSRVPRRGSRVQRRDRTPQSLPPSSAAPPQPISRASGAECTCLAGSIGLR
ncbi:hypothetical protein DOTSEDRAFT_74240 [Dothistroma septosporum NZE10]|uniref:Uncharacterized protein n=1 Tax=Dothistroma septosporum (strain NZE10 / CBS 128990) TaxID=675120 RepID=N1PGF2_DOTSN|nr:hypothetical protein DOTSEDRAFT_74240 [Dothistroma septosporum NZE10]